MQSRISSGAIPHSRWPVVFLPLCCLVLALLWLPNLRFPLVSDPGLYGLLGKSVWEHGTYILLGQPFAKHLPLHAILSYPLTRAFGLQAGMKLLSLLAGWGVLMATFLLARRAFGSRLVAALAVIGVLLHPAFVLMATMGSADLTFTFFFLMATTFLLRASDHPRSYALAGLCAGLMCLTRYNGFPLLVLFPAWVLWRRPAHRAHRFFWTGTLLSLFLPSLWFARNFLTFGDPLHTEYTGELARIAPDHVRQFLSNLFYYANPIHNVLPVLLLLSLYGVWRFQKTQFFLILCMLAVWALTAVWWVQAIRFAFPGYPILIAFAAAGFLDLCRRYKRIVPAFAVGVSLLFLGSHLLSLCLYSYGACNAWYDRSIGGIPRNLGLTPEGSYAWDQARAYLNAHAEPGATFATNDPYNAVVWQADVFRKDIRVVEHGGCGSYRITQEAPTKPSEQMLYQTLDAPVTYVVQDRCPA